MAMLNNQMVFVRDFMGFTVGFDGDVSCWFDRGDFIDLIGMATITCRGLDHETFGLHYNLIQV